MREDATSTGRSLLSRKGTRARGRPRRFAAAAMTAALGASLLAACGGQSGPPELNWYINPDSGGQAEIAKRCTEAAGGKYRITTQLLPREASAQREQLVRRLASNDSSIDLISLDPPFIPEFAQAGFLAPIPEDVATKATAGVVDSAVKGSSWDGELVTIPFWANTQLLWYKKSKAKAAGLDMSKPVTWQQLVEAAKKDKSSIAVQGIRAEALTVWVNALIASAGGTIVENPTAKPKDVKLGLRSDATKQAAQVVKSIVGQGVGGPGLSNRNEDASAALFESGGADYMVNWPFVWPRAQGFVEAKTLKKSVIDDYGWALYPRVDADKASKPPLGGISLGVGAFSRYKDFALAATACITTPENQAYYFTSNGNPAVKESVYDDPEVLKAFPQAPVIRESLKAAAPRPQTPYYNEVSVGLQRTWSPPSGVDPNTTPAKSDKLIRGVLGKKDLL